MRSQVEDDVGEVSSAYVVHEPRQLYFPEGTGKTRQEFAADCDINVIMARYEKTGVISHMSPRKPMYVDFSEMPDSLQDALSMLEEAKSSFMTLPASVRAEFENDPVSFVTFAADPKNLDQMREWGLAPPKGEPEPLPEVPPASSPAS